MSLSWLDYCTQTGRQLGRGLLHLIYPACCHFCGCSLTADGPFCDACRGALFTDVSAACPRCAATVGPFAVIGGRCAQCRDEAFSFDAALRLGPYDGLLREAVLRLKNHAGEGMAELFGELWADYAGSAFRALGVDARSSLCRCTGGDGGAAATTKAKPSRTVYRNGCVCRAAPRGCAEHARRRCRRRKRWREDARMYAALSPRRFRCKDGTFCS